jgi:type VI protein secretion system component VasF
MIQTVGTMLQTIHYRRLEMERRMRRRRITIWCLRAIVLAGVIAMFWWMWK